MQICSSASKARRRKYQVMNDFKEYSAKTVDEAINNALMDLGVATDQMEYEVIEQGSTGFLGLIGAKPALIKARKKPEQFDNVRSFLSDMFKAMNMEVETEITYDPEERTLDVVFSGEEMGILIGKRGQTLDSIQYLISLVVNKDSENYIRVKADTENYRERRKNTLESLAKNIAYKVRRTRRPVALEPMNPYERRIIHSALQGDKYVETHSEGEEPYRKVVITLKRGVREQKNNNRRQNGRTSAYAFTDEDE